MNRHDKPHTSVVEQVDASKVVTDSISALQPQNERSATAAESGVEFIAVADNDTAAALDLVPDAFELPLHRRPSPAKVPSRDDRIADGRDDNDVHANPTKHLEWFFGRDSPPVEQAVRATKWLRQEVSVVNMRIDDDTAFVGNGPNHDITLRPEQECADRGRTRGSKSSAVTARYGCYGECS